jgi:diguanylate cyclase (GGDEF)-like protein
MTMNGLLKAINRIGGSSGKPTKHYIPAQFLQLGYYISIATLVISSLALIGHLIQIEALYRPLPELGGINTYTSSVATVLAIGIILIRQGYYRLFVITMMAILALFCLAYFPLKLYQVTTNKTATPLSNGMAWNTALMYGLYASALFFQGHQRYIVVQSLLGVALLFPLLSFTGYLFQLSALYGSMSPISTVLGFLLFLSISCLSANRWALKAVLSPYIGGKIARAQLSLGWVLVLIIGRIAYEPTGLQSHYVGVVVATCWLISITAVVSALAYENIDKARRKMQRSLYEASIKDLLTNIPNRRFFFEQAQQLLELSKRTNTPISLIMLDIDNFKSINDHYGHIVGDEVIKSVAQIMQNNRRLSDLICRYGGEEFLVLLVNTNIDGALLVAEDIRTKIEHNQITTKEQNTISITISLGIVSQAHCEHSLSELIAHADSALYQAKKRGKNQSVVFAPNTMNTDK